MSKNKNQENKEKSHQIKLVHSNLYQICSTNEKEVGMTVKSVVIKAHDLMTPIQSYQPNALVSEPSAPTSSAEAAFAAYAKQSAQLLNSRQAMSPDSASDTVITAPVTVALLKQNLENLQSLQARLRFILKELEELA